MESVNQVSFNITNIVVNENKIFGHTERIYIYIYSRTCY